MLPRCVTFGGSLRTGGDAGVVKGQGVHPNDLIPS
jgi:hypothetical protein